MRRKAVWLALLLFTAAVHAQLVTPDPDWQEAEAPPPPPLRTDALIPLDVPRSTLRFGVDPASVALGQDGVVRYVVVATTSGGAVNAMYEGIRCNTGEFKVFARHEPGRGWVVAKGRWRELHEQPVSPHSLAVARNGACVGHGANHTAAQIVRDLRAPVDTRFNLN